jgi:hypothetical protein
MKRIPSELPLHRPDPRLHLPQIEEAAIDEGKGPLSTQGRTGGPRNSQRVAVDAGQRDSHRPYIMHGQVYRKAPLQPVF